MKTLLITGFDPFGGETINPSWEAVSRLPDTIGDYSLTKLRIPVIFSDAANKVIEVADRLSPDAILCIGQAGGRDSITPEMVGINLRYAKIPDNSIVAHSAIVTKPFEERNVVIAGNPAKIVKRGINWNNASPIEYSPSTADLSF